MPGYKDFVYISHIKSGSYKLLGKMGILWLLRRRPTFRDEPVIFAFLIGVTLGTIAAFLRLYPVIIHSDRWGDLYCKLELESAKAISNKKMGCHKSNESLHFLENTTVADRLKQTVRVLCMVITTPKNHEKRARHIKATWGRRCNKLIFISSQQNDLLPSVALPVKDGRLYQWRKTKEAFKFIYRNHFREADWFVKANDDTFLIVENLRYMLKRYDPASPIYFGCKFKPYVEQGYMTSAAGYVLSSEALKRFVLKGLTGHKYCRPDDSKVADIEMGFCLQALNVTAGDSRDSAGRGRFFPFRAVHHLAPGNANLHLWYWKYIYYDSKQGLGCCADSAISFHYIKPFEMYILEYWIYHMKPYGISFKSEEDDEKII